MHADIHDGPEHTLQSEAGYIDARPLSTRSTKASCNARPDHTLGSFSTDLAGLPSRSISGSPQKQTSSIY